MMPKTRAETVRADARVAAAQLLDDLSPFIAPANLEQARRLILRSHRRRAEKAIDVYTTVPDTEGDLVLLRTTSKKFPDVFRVMSTKCADYRIAMAQRELPFGRLVEVARFHVDKVRTAKRKMLARLETYPGVTARHDEYFEIAGGAARIQGVVERVAKRVNGEPIVATKIPVRRSREPANA